MDRERVRDSRALHLLPHLTLNIGIKKYFLQKLSLNCIRIIAQTRLLNNFTPRISIRKKHVKLGVEGWCKVCGMESAELLFHMLIECQAHAIERQQFISTSWDKQSIIVAFLKKLDNANKETLLKLNLYISRIMQKLMIVN